MPTEIETLMNPPMIGSTALTVLSVVGALLYTKVTKRRMLPLAHYLILGVVVGLTVLFLPRFYEKNGFFKGLGLSLYSTMGVFFLNGKFDSLQEIYTDSAAAWAVVLFNAAKLLTLTAVLTAFTGIWPSALCGMFLPPFRGSLSGKGGSLFPQRIYDLCQCPSRLLPFPDHIYIIA